MHKIEKANASHKHIIQDIGIQSFKESHGHSASEKDINKFITKSFSLEVMEEELSHPDNIYHIIEYNGEVAGYSKIILNVPNKNVESKKITKMERLYLLKEFYGLGLGEALMNYNLDYAMNNHQDGIWLHVWIENGRAVKFYKKSGFEVKGTHDYVISADHTNPNYVMYKSFK